MAHRRPCSNAATLVVTGLRALVLLAWLVCLPSCTGVRASDAKISSGRLGVLIGAPHGDESAMLADVQVAYDALRGRGFEDREVLRVEGRINRQSLFDALDEVERRVSMWRDGSVFLYFSGHGTVLGDSLTTASPAILFENDEVAWDLVLGRIARWSNVHVTLLVDC